MQRVLCNAIVDEIRMVKPGERGLNTYRVEVWGREPHDYVRIYEIAMRSDTLAAQEGLRRFVEEMEQLDQQSGN